MGILMFLTWMTGIHSVIHQIHCADLAHFRGSKTLFKGTHMCGHMCKSKLGLGSPLNLDAVVGADDEEDDREDGKWDFDI
jgi:hypothetical protein